MSLGHSTTLPPELLQTASRFRFFLPPCLVSAIISRISFLHFFAEKTLVSL